MTPQTDVQLVVDARATLGECALWCDRTASLFWTDIEACTLHRWQPDTGESRQWTLPERLGSFVLCQTPGRLLLGLASGVALFDLESGVLGEVLPIEPDQPTTRINDGRCDRQGRFVFGTFNEARGGAAIGHFHRVAWRDGALHSEQLALPAIRVANSIAFSPDGRTMYFADSPTREILAVDYGDAVGEPRVFVRLADGDGFPDGAVTDAHGGLWSTHWDGGCVVRHAADGSESLRVPLPVKRPTCPAFGGAGWQDLYLSTARIGLKAPEPEAGGILRLRTRWHGLPEPRFPA
jgi:L-arabinonolactonase